ncbi:MAG: formylmethanofuran dehydrogenase subunit B [Gammaproteobacteria bacterium]
MAETNSSVEYSNIACPFCGLACDDLRVKLDDTGVEVTENGCDISSRGFQQASDGARSVPQIEGAAVSMDDALARAAELLRAARVPVIGGLATDVNGARAVMALARRSRAVIDHMNGAGLFRNQQILQDDGWIATSLTEARNRADLIVLAGARVFELFPRLLERIIYPGSCVFPTGKQRELVLIGPWKPSTLPPELTEWKPTIIPVALTTIGEAVASLRAMVAGRPLQICGIEGVDINTLNNVACRLRHAKYSVITWAAGELDFPHAELTVQALVELARDLNGSTRSGVLPLGGAQGDVTMNQVSLWQSGYPLRSSFSRDRTEHDPVLFDYRRVLSQGGADALLWLSTFLPHTPPPETDIPTIVVGHPGISLLQPPAVYIPVGVPGIDHAGHIYRGDVVVPLPLRRLRESSLLPAADVLTAITARL